MGWPPGRESVITSLAGFAGAPGGVGSEVDARSGGPVDSSADGFPASKSVITCMAGFEAARRPQPPGDRTAIPAAFRYTLAVSRRTPVAPWMRRRLHPSRPNARTCCFLSSLKTLAMPTEGTNPQAGVNVPEVGSVGRFSGDHGWPVLGVHRGRVPEPATRR